MPGSSDLNVRPDEVQELLCVQLTGSRIMQWGMPCLVCTSDATALTQQDLQ